LKLKEEGRLRVLEIRALRRILWDVIVDWRKLRSGEFSDFYSSSYIIRLNRKLWWSRHDGEAWEKEATSKN
jgi:hypothetical protein